MRLQGYSSSGWGVAGTALALCGALALAGCGSKRQETDVIKAQGQVIAHVGSEDITQPELDNEMRLANVPPDKRKDDAIIKAVLSRVIERKYLEQQAVAAKLDREPTVHLDLDRAREQVLASAFIQRQVGSKISGISNSEVDAYIQAHPDKFANRQIFNIEQVSFVPQKEMKDLATAVKTYNSLDQVTAKLDQLGIKYSRGPGALDSATLPSEMMKPLVARKPDDIFFVRSRTSASFFKVTSAESKPLAGEEAAAFARREVREEIARKLAKDTLDAALASAKYEGDVARVMKAPTPTPEPTSAENPVAPGTEATQPQPGEPATTEKENLDKEQPKK